jgi:hypothetical protein
VKTLPLSAEARAGWEAAQQLWGVSMHDASFAVDADVPSFAWFSFPPSVSVDPVLAKRSGVDGEWATIFAHELGHHVLSPSTRLDQFKIEQQMARALSATSVGAVPDIAQKCSYLSNLWSDMLINVRVAQLQRAAAAAEEPGMVRMWRILCATPTTDPAWWAMMRAYEELWSLPDGTLCGETPPLLPAAPATGATDYTSLFAANPVADALLLADTVRSFGDDPIRGALRFGMILAPYVLAAQQQNETGPAVCAGEIGGRQPTAEELGEIMRDGRLREAPQHPASAPGATGSLAGEGEGQGYGLAQTLKLYDADLAAAVIEGWYTTRARAWTRPLTQRAQSASSSGDELPAALEQWSIDDEVESIDWPATLAGGPRVIPGVTTRMRSHITDEAPADRQSVYLDLYIDSSGSMRSPASESPAVLAGTILILSVLRGGGRVRVTSFSGPGQVAGTPEFTRDRVALMGALTTFFAGGTTFPLDLLAQRYAQKLPASSAVSSMRHLVVLSDEGLMSFFGEGQQAHAAVAARVRGLLDTATLMVIDTRHRIGEAADRAGYEVEYLTTMDDAPRACAQLARRIERYRRTVRHG